MYEMAQESIGQTLVKQNLITQEQLKKALRRREEEYDLLGNILVKMGFVAEDEVLRCLALRQGVEQVDLSKKGMIDPQVVGIIPGRLAKRSCLIAIALKDKTLTVAMADPTDIVAIDTIKRNTGYEVRSVSSLKKDILKAIDKYYGGVADIGRSIEDVISIDTENVGIERVDTEQLKIEAGDPPIVRFVNLLLLQALEERATYTSNLVRKKSVFACGLMVPYARLHHHRKECTRLLYLE
jgi:type IV pilus assembly protein PilB